MKKKLKTQTTVIMVVMAQSRSFENLSKLILALILKHHFILMIFFCHHTNLQKK
jgi:hypothetical protein